MARALVVGCGCSGRALGRELRDRGWQVRGTTRGPGLDEIEGAGLEAVVADPERPGTILELVGDVTVVVWLLGSAEGGDELLRAIHGPRLERLLEALVDTPVRGFAYEVTGSVPDALLQGGRAQVERAAETWRIPFGLLEADRSHDDWAARAADAVVSVVER
jgi:nucleoside-diphosphate-sugar epimerase